MTSAASGICVVIKPRRAAGYTHHEGNMGRDVIITGGYVVPVSSSSPGWWSRGWAQAAVCGEQGSRTDARAHVR